MIIKYEKVIGEGEEMQVIECPESEATQVHYCRNDDEMPCTVEIL